MLRIFSSELYASGDPDGFFTGCAISPFKITEAETHAQYQKLDKKLMAGASFIITQLGYDVKKFKELMTYLEQKGENSAVMGSVYQKTAAFLEKTDQSRLLKLLLEDPFKKSLLSCRSCGDCAIQHLAFLCPESGCPKHTRNGACGGSRDGWCEMNEDRKCVWVRAYKRLKHCGLAHELAMDFVPPRMWELNKTSSWINFHLGKDHQKKK